jgi:hypothetical protein
LGFSVTFEVAKGSMKVFGLFEKGSVDPIETFEGVLTVIEGKTLRVYGELDPGKEERKLITEIPLMPGQSIHELRSPD